MYIVLTFEAYKLYPRFDFASCAFPDDGHDVRASKLQLSPFHITRALVKQHTRAPITATAS
jgi:hypothetical protein